MTIKNILLVNDDGIESPTLIPCINALSQYFKVWVMVPEQERSTVGHGLTVHKPLRVKVVKGVLYERAQKVWKMNGKPADCVKVALRNFVDQVDLVFSGINLGPNLGMDTIYSGTVAGAMEGVIEGKKGFAASIETHDPELNFEPAAKFVAQFLNEKYEPTAQVWNMNLPYRTDYKLSDVKVGPLGYVEYEDLLEKRRDPRGQDYFWIQGKKKDSYQVEPGCDVDLIRKGFVSLTPMKLDRTDHSFLTKA